MKKGVRIAIISAIETRPFLQQSHSYFFGCKGTSQLIPG